MRSIRRPDCLSNGPGTTAFPGQVLFNDVAGSIGNTARNAFDGPGYFNIDTSLFKTIRLTEGVKLQLRAEAFNLLNHTNFAITNQYRNISNPMTSVPCSASGPSAFPLAQLL